jgi:hypothetical protein
MSKSKKSVRQEEKIILPTTDDLLSILREQAAIEKLKASKSNTKTFNERVARDTLFIQQVEEAAKVVFANKITPTGWSLKKSDAPTERALNLILSDLHFHALLDDTEGPHNYGPIEEARRLAKIVLETAEYKVQYRKETELNLSIIGDIIQGQLHDPRDGAPLAMQVAAAAHLLVQAIAFLASQFPKVKVRCATGNHGRNPGRHKDRAVLQKHDSIETMLYVALKHGVAHIKNVTVDIPKTPYLTYKVFDKRIFGTHGDTVLNPGNPGQAIKVNALEQQINRINASLPDAEEYSVFFCGHVHVGSLVHLPNGSTLITNGCLIPSDAFAVSIGLFEVTCGQTLFESVKGYAAGDYRFIYVDKATDKDASLDKIIAPYLSGVYV